MYLFQRTKDLETYLRSERVNNRTVGFVPTMGALHEGHMALIRRSLAENQITVCSIFVNPTQFNNAEDLKKYPRTPGKDLGKLALVGCNVAFLPAVDEVYPPDQAPRPPLDLKELDKHMEGAKRPGHFAGVVQVVHRLLELVQPDHLYMGQKDFQQLQIIRYMINTLDLPVQLYMVPTERQADGLALSSRNLRLSEERRREAVLVHQTLAGAQARLKEGQTAEQITKWAMQELDRTGFQPEYFTLADASTLQPVQQIQDHDTIVACTAVWADEVRLIDNMVIKGKIR